MNGTMQRSNAMMDQDVKVMNECTVKRRRRQSENLRTETKMRAVGLGAEAKSTHLVATFLKKTSNPDTDPFGVGLF
jgi:hypothetical protein